MSKIIVDEPAKPSRTEGFVQKVMASLVSRLLLKAIEYLSENE